MSQLVYRRWLDKCERAMALAREHADRTLATEGQSPLAQAQLRRYGQLRTAAIARLTARTDRLGAIATQRANEYEELSLRCRHRAQHARTPETERALLDSAALLSRLSGLFRSVETRILGQYDGWLSAHGVSGAARTVWVAPDLIELRDEPIVVTEDLDLAIA